MSEAQLITQARRGDRDALSALLRPHALAVHQLCQRIVGPQLAKDASQDALTKAIERIRSFDPERGEFRTWLFAIARNTCRDRFRRAKTRGQALRPAGEGEIDDAVSPSDIAATVENKRSLEDVQRALSALPEGMRDALIMFHFEGAPYEAIAKQLNVPKGTVMTWLHRGRRKLREAVEQSR